MAKISNIWWGCLGAVAAVLLTAYDATAASGNAFTCNPRDIVMLVDETGMTNSEFKKVENLAKAVISDFNVGIDSDDDRFALYGFTNEITHEFNFGSIKNANKLKKFIKKLSPISYGVASLPMALEHALEKLNKFGRDSAQKVIIVVSGSFYEIPSDQTSVVGVCDNIAAIGDLTEDSLAECVENFLDEAMDDEVIMIHVPTSAPAGDDSVQEVTTSAEANYATCPGHPTASPTTSSPTVSPTTSSPTASPTSAPTLDTSCYVWGKKYTSTIGITGVKNPTKKIRSSTACGELCFETDGCEFFTYQVKGKKCYMYSAAGSSANKKVTSYVSGTKSCETRSVEGTTAAPTTAAPTTAAPTTAAPTIYSLENALIADKITLSSPYFVSFKFTLNAINNASPQAIIHRGKAKTDNLYHRQPAVFVSRGEQTLLLRSNVNGGKNNGEGCETTIALDFGVEYQIKVFVEEGNVMQLWINDDLGCQVETSGSLNDMDTAYPFYTGGLDGFPTAYGTVSDVSWDIVSDEDAEDSTGDEDSEDSTGDEDSEDSTGDEDSEDSTGDEDSEDSTGDEDAEDSTGDEDAEESTGDEDAEESTGDEDAEESTGDEDAEESTGDEDAEESTGDEDAEESTGDEDAEGVNRLRRSLR